MDITNKLNEFKNEIKDELVVSSIQEITKTQINPLLETVNTKLENIVSNNMSLNEELTKTKHINEVLTIKLDETQEEVERLSTLLQENAESHKSIVEYLTVERDSALSELEDIRVSNKVYELLDKNLPLRLISEDLHACKTMDELNLKVELFTKSFSKMENVVSFKNLRKGVRYLNEEKEMNPEKKYTKEEANQRDLAGKNENKGD